MTTGGTAPLAYDLIATQGTDFALLFSFTQSAGGLTGTTGTMSVLKLDGTAAAVASFTGSLVVASDTTASITVSLTSAQIATLTATGTAFKYALNVTKSAVVSPWLAGSLSLIPPGVGQSTTNSAFTITAGTSTVTGTLQQAAAGLPSSLSLIFAYTSFV